MDYIFSTGQIRPMCNYILDILATVVGELIDISIIQLNTACCVLQQTKATVATSFMVIFRYIKDYSNNSNWQKKIENC